MLPDTLQSLSLRDLNAIPVLARTLHFGRAAEACGMAQSSLSALVRRVEEAVGHPIFARSSRRVALTPAGAEVVETIERVLREAESLDPTSRPADELTGWVRLGAISTLGPYLIPELLPTLRARFPEARFLLTEALTEELVGGLHAQRIDAAFLSLPVEAPGLEAHPLFDEELLLAIPAGHRLAERDRVARADVPTSELIQMDHGHCLRDDALQVCGTTGSSVPTHATGIETLCGMVAAGVGCAVVPELATRRSRGMDDLIVWRRLEDPVPTRTIGLVLRAVRSGEPRGRRLLPVLGGLRLPVG